MALVVGSKFSFPVVWNIGRGALDRLYAKTLTSALILFLACNFLFNLGSFRCVHRILGFFTPPHYCFEKKRNILERVQNNDSNILSFPTVQGFSRGVVVVI